MGIEDLFKAEETVVVRLGYYTTLVRNMETLDTIREAMEKGVPLRYIQTLLTGKAPDYDCDLAELEAYRATGITPNRFKVIDEEYQNAELKANLDVKRSVVLDKDAQIRQLQSDNEALKLTCQAHIANIDTKRKQYEDMKKKADLLSEACEGYKKKLADLKATNEELHGKLAQAQEGIKISVPIAGSTEVQI